MAAPLKPWERPGACCPGTDFQNNAPIPSNSMAAGPFGTDSLQQAAMGGSPVAAVSTAPPELPPRPSQQSSSLGTRYGGMGGVGYGLGGMSSYGGGYGGYSSAYGGYSGLGGGMYNSPYSSYGGGYGGYQNRMGDMHSQFARQAEESSRPAFESIESIVSAVNAVGMMLDSTFQAVYNSFRAVIGVADNFSRLKSQLMQVFSALAFIRTLRYMYRRLLEILRLKPPGEANRQWMEAFSEAAQGAVAGPGGAPKKSSWPIIMFFGIIMGGPYLIWKIISSFSSSSSDHPSWASGESDHFVARANHSFQSQGGEEISFSQGQTLNVAPKELQPRVRGWLLASVDGKTTGLVPANYVKVLGKRRGTKSQQVSTPGQSQQVSTPSQSQAIPTLQQSESRTNFSQEFESASQANPGVSESQLESMFSADSVSPVLQPNNPSFTQNNQISKTNQEAADILNDVR